MKILVLVNEMGTGKEHFQPRPVLEVRDTHLFRVLARYLVPFLLASEGYFFCRKACSSRMESATDFLLLMSS